MQRCPASDVRHRPESLALTSRQETTRVSEPVSDVQSPRRSASHSSPIPREFLSQRSGSTRTLVIAARSRLRLSSLGLTRPPRKAGTTSRVASTLSLRGARPARRSGGRGAAPKDGGHPSVSALRRPRSSAAFYFSLCLSPRASAASAVRSVRPNAARGVRAKRGARWPRGLRSGFSSVVLFMNAAICRRTGRKCHPLAVSAR